MEEVHLDFETRSTADLRKTGVLRYAEDPTTDIWGFAYRFDEVARGKRVKGEPLQWRLGDPEPLKLIRHIRDGGKVTGHHVQFEFEIWNKVFRRYFPNAPKLKIGQLDCTMGRALAVARPRSLDELGVAAGLNATKDKAGHRLMMKMARPRRIEADGTLIWWDEPENVDRLMEYCERDVEVEAEADEFLLPLDPRERDLWELDFEIGERGIAIDLDFAKRVTKITTAVKKRIDKQIAELTRGAVTTHGQVARMTKWLRDRGHHIDKLDKQAVNDWLPVLDRVDSRGAQLLRYRQAGAKTSTAKFNTMCLCVGADSRIHYTTVFHAATTGRWGGALVQTQNFTRIDYERDGPNIYFIRYVVKKFKTSQAIDVLELCFGLDQIMPMLSKCLRPTLIAAEDHILIGADFKNIEGRVNAWLSGETWKIKAFQDYDAGVGEDLYKIAYASAFGVSTEDVQSFERQLGKVQELALGYQGSIGAFLTMVTTYSMDIPALVGPVKKATAYELLPGAHMSVWDQARLRYEAAPRQFGLTEEEYAAIDILVRRWRKANPAIKQAWRSVQDAAVEAIENPNVRVPASPSGNVAYYFDGHDLWCELPSGRLLCYASAEVVASAFEYVSEEGDLIEAEGKSIRFWGAHKKTKKWSRISTYGGKLWENIVQAVARDVMRDAMLRLDEAGYPIILTVHDEVIAEVALEALDALGLSEKRFASIMAARPAWVENLPIAVSAWSAREYIK